VKALFVIGHFDIYHLPFLKPETRNPKPETKDRRSKDSKFNEHNFIRNQRI